MLFTVHFKNCLTFYLKVEDFTVLAKKCVLTGKDDVILFPGSYMFNAQETMRTQLGPL